MTNETIIIDSSGLTALINENDEFHNEAVKIIHISAANNLQAILPYEIFAETVTGISKKVSREAGVIAARAILKRCIAGNFILSEADKNIHEQSILFLQTAKGVKGAPSFFDCLVMAFAKHYATAYIFGFDKAFQKNGFQLPGEEATKVSM